MENELDEIAKASNIDKISYLIKILIMKDRLNLLEAIGKENAYGYSDWLDYPIKLPTLPKPGKPSG